MTTFNINPSDEIAARVVEHFKGEIKANDFGFIYRRYPAPPKTDPDMFTDGEIHGYRAQVPFYPASVVKVFFMVALLEQVKEKTIILDKEDKRALKNMIQISSNDATGYLLGRITDTTGGKALPPSKMEAWWEKRSWVQHYFDRYNWPQFDSIKLYHSTFEECPYGREQISRDIYGSNVLTPLAAATLMHAIAAGQMVDPDASEQMMGLLSRDWERDPKLLETWNNDQVRGYIVESVPADLNVWSKSGSTSVTRHDLVYVESPQGPAMTMAAFSQGKVCAGNKQFLPTLGRFLLEQIS